MNKEILLLADRLPEANHSIRLKHTNRFGHLIILKENGKIVGFSELYRMRKIPSYPVSPLIKSDPAGKILYVYSCVSEPGYLRKLKSFALQTITGCELLCYHRSKYKNKLYVERIKP